MLLIKLLFICIFCSCFNNNDKIKYSYINNNVVIILKKIIGGKCATLLGDFALESSENLIFLNQLWYRLQTHNLLSIFLSDSNKSYHFEGILMENVKINNFGKIAHYQLICQHGSRTHTGSISNH